MLLYKSSLKSKAVTIKRSTYYSYTVLKIFPIVYNYYYYYISLQQFCKGDHITSSLTDEKTKAIENKVTQLVICVLVFKVSF